MHRVQSVMCRGCMAALGPEGDGVGLHVEGQHRVSPRRAVRAAAGGQAAAPGAAIAAARAAEGAAAHTPARARRQRCMWAR